MGMCGTRENNIRSHPFFFEMVQVSSPNIVIVAKKVIKQVGSHLQWTELQGLQMSTSISAGVDD